MLITSELLLTYAWFILASLARVRNDLLNYISMSNLERSLTANTLLDIYFSRRCVGCGLPLEPYILLFPKRLVKVSVSSVDGIVATSQFFACHTCMDKAVSIFSDRRDWPDPSIARLRIAAWLAASDYDKDCWSRRSVTFNLARK